MNEVLCLGEALIDFVADVSGVSLIQCPGFRKAAGGGVANVAVALSRQGAPAAFLGKVGSDPFGEFLRLTLSQEGVDTSCMLLEPNTRTGLAFVSLTESGERDFVFFRHPSADMLYRADELPERRLAACAALHFSSITLIQEPSREATLSAVEQVRRAGGMVSFDPNLRPPLWPSTAAAESEIRNAARLADLIKVSEEEALLIAGEGEFDRQIERIHSLGPAIVALTRGAHGSLLSLKGGPPVEIAPQRIEAVDATGAGDAYAASLIAAVLRSGGPGALRKEDLPALGRQAGMAGALTCLKKGAIPALPRGDEIEQALARL